MEENPQQQQQQQQPPKPEPDPALKGVVGLQNMGNTCYANSSLQLLRAVPEWNVFCLREDFEKACPDKDTVQAKLLLAYQDLIRSMWSAYRPSYVRPMGFLTIVRDLVKGTVYESFGQPRQNDSHEYMVWLLDNFHEALNEKRGAPPLPQPPDESEKPMAEQGDDGWAAFTHRNVSPVVDLFFGMMRKTIECQECHTKNYKWETFNVFKIPCKGATFQEWIKAECSVTDLEGRNCEPCQKAGKGRQLAHMYSHVWRLPSSLFVAIKRFETADGRKIHTPCPYDGAPICFGEHFAPESTHPSKEWIYECRAIADHHGSQYGGHYSAQMAHPVTNSWWWVDDPMTQPLPGPRLSGANYVLYFRGGGRPAPTGAGFPPGPPTM